MLASLEDDIKFIPVVGRSSWAFFESNWGCHFLLLSAISHLISSDLVPALLPTPESYAGPRLWETVRLPLLPRLGKVNTMLDHVPSPWVADASLIARKGSICLSPEISVRHVCALDCLGIRIGRVTFDILISPAWLAVGDANHMCCVWATNSKDLRMLPVFSLTRQCGDLLGPPPGRKPV